MNGGGEQKLLFPSLAGFYSCFGEIAYALVRVITGYNVFMHGYGKVSDFAGVSAYMTKVGLVPAAFFAGANIFLETVGAVCIIVGLFTRFFAAALAVVCILAAHPPKL